jgi:hypothetical protein
MPLRRGVRLLSRDILSFRRDLAGVERYCVRLGAHNQQELVMGADGRLRNEETNVVFEYEGEDPLAAVLQDYKWDVAAAPKWPAGLQGALSRAPLAGAGTLCFDAGRFGELITGNDDAVWPVVFPGASTKLHVPGLRRLEKLAAVVSGDFKGDDQFSLKCALGSLAADQQWAEGGGGDGSGRLFAEHASGDLAQVCEGSIWQQLARATGDGPLEAVFKTSDASIGVAFAPHTKGDRGAEVMQVDAESAGAREGVRPGMTLTGVQGRQVARVPFERILDILDSARAAAPAVELRFATALSAARYYAVECPVATIPALALARQPHAENAENAESAKNEAADAGQVDVASEFLAALDSHRPGTRAAFTWREAAARSFVGEPGSMTCLHTDMIPQLQFAHGLAGTKMLGVASIEATPSILDRYNGAPGDEARVPVHVSRTLGGGEGHGGEECLEENPPLSEEQLELLAAVSIAVLQAGDAVVFASAAAHFGTNGNASPNVAVYHGALTGHRLAAADEAATREGIALRQAGRV